MGKEEVVAKGDGSVDTVRMDSKKVFLDVKAARQVAEQFVQLVRELPYVRQVRLDEHCVEPCVWTVIEVTPPDDQQRDRVYDAELEASKAYPGVLLDFRLINAAEFPGTPADELVPAQADVLLER